MGLAETVELAVRIGLHDGLTPGLAKINRSLGGFQTSVGRAGKGVGQLAGGVVRAGAIIAGAAATGLGVAAKTAIEFDDAFAAVRKTVDASDPELQALNDQLHALATRIPVNYTDLAGIAAEAGALGVPTKSVAKFTETVARLSAATQGLTTEAAAEAFGKFRNTLKLADGDLTRAASSLIALGNAGASSEGDIIEVAKRFGAAGHQAGLSAAQVLGFSSAIASLGVEPEAAGSSLSRLFNNITKYIGTGNKKIVAFAQTAGVSVKTFDKLFAHDAKGAVLDFLTGLSKLDKFQAANVLKHAGITNVRDINAVLLLSQNVDELKRQLGLSSAAFQANTALADVSAKRFDTLKNKIIVLKNNFLEAGYNIAEGFLPALGRAADKLTAFLQLPENKKELQNLGAELGKALDKVDFGKLLEAAKGAVKVLDPMVTALLKIAQILDGLPPEIKGAAGALLVTNKLSGGLIGAGAGNIFGGLAGALAKSLASSIPVFGKAFVQPVFVTNMGLGGGGGLGGGVGGAGGASGLAKGLFALSIVTDIAAVVATQQQQNAQNAELAQGIKTQLDQGINVKTPAELQMALDGVNQGINDIQSNPLNVLVGGDALNTLKEMRDELTTRKLNTEIQSHNRSERNEPLKTPKQIFKELKIDGINLTTLNNNRLHNLGTSDHAIKELGSLQKQLATAQRSGNTHLAREIQLKIDHLKERVATGDQTMVNRLGTANTKLGLIAHKKTNFTAHTTVNVSTSVSVSELKRQARYASRVARTTHLSAS